MVTPIKVLLFLAGGSAAAATTAYVAGVFDPYLNPPAAEAPAQTTPKVAALPPAEAPQEKAAAPAAATPPAEVAAPQPEVQVPSFDLVRVQGDGSIVIAGRAAPQARVEAVIGSRVIGSAVAGPDGDFAIAVDQPLKPGNYQIVLRSTAPGNVVATSTETAVVSVPEAPDGQVLALVEAPGKPAELITVPKPRQPNAEAPAAPAAGTSDTTAKPATAARPAEEQPPAKPLAPDGKPAVTEDQPAAAGDKPATSEAAPAEEKPAAPAGDQVAAAPKPAPAQPPVEQAAGEPRVAVEAVEIEGRRIFVAGSADPGRLLRAYANETLLGQTTASPAGRFLVEAERDLPVGDYIIRVDALEPNGSKVLARAAVPFEREAGENIAAVAPHMPRAEQAPAAGAKPGDKPAAAAASEQAAQTGTVQPQAPAATPAETAPAAGTAAETAPQAPAAAQPQAPEQPAVAADPAEQSGQPSAAPTEALAPKLQSVDGAVIIRRGDTLWRISRRVYGYGTRYSTIYLANQDQIRDPDLILPGQVFSVPERSGQGEKADMTRLGAQAVPPPVRQ
jgi:nucleoid-associated protein YgaU